MNSPLTKNKQKKINAKTVNNAPISMPQRAKIIRRRYSELEKMGHSVEQIRAMVDSPITTNK